MDNPYHIDYIRKIIDKTFSDAEEVRVRPVNFRHTMVLYCAGYIQACVNFGIISVPKHEEFIKYMEGKKL